MGGTHKLPTWAALEEDQAGVLLVAVDNFLCSQRLTRGRLGWQWCQLMDLAPAEAVCRQLSSLHQTDVGWEAQPLAHPVHSTKTESISTCTTYCIIHGKPLQWASFPLTAGTEMHEEVPQAPTLWRHPSVLSMWQQLRDGRSAPYLWTRPEGESGV